MIKWLVNKLYSYSNFQLCKEIEDNSGYKIVFATVDERFLFSTHTVAIFKPERFSDYWRRVDNGRQFEHQYNLCINDLHTAYTVGELYNGSEEKQKK